MKVYLVNAWDSYYPSWDNTVAVFSNESDAFKFLETYKSHFDYVDIIEKEVIHESNSD